MLKERIRGPIGQWLARRLAPAFNLYPAGLHQRVDHGFGNRHAPNRFDLCARDWLAVGNDRQGFERRLAEFLLNLALFHEEIRQVLRCLEAPFAGDLDQVHPPVHIKRPQGHQHFSGFNTVRKNFRNLRCRQWFTRCEQNSLSPAHAFSQRLVHVFVQRFFRPAESQRELRDRARFLLG